MLCYVQDERIRGALRALDAAASTYSSSFAKLCEDVIAARVEANDNVRYLQPLRPWLERLEQEEHFPGIVQVWAGTGVRVSGPWLWLHVWTWV